MKFLDWSRDYWTSREGSTFIRYDKLEHALLAFVGVLFLSAVLPFTTHLPVQACQMIVRAFGVLYEIYNGFVPYRGGGGMVQGFSWKDLIANEAGLRLAGDFIFLWSII